MVEKSIMKDNQTARKKQQEAKILNAEKNAQNQADESICCSEHLLLFKYFHQTEEQQEKNTNRWHFFAQEHRYGIKEAPLRRHKARQPARKTSRRPSRPKKAARLKETE